MLLLLLLLLLQVTWAKDPSNQCMYRGGRENYLPSNVSDFVSLVGDPANTFKIFLNTVSALVSLCHFLDRSVSAASTHLKAVHICRVWVALREEYQIQIQNQPMGIPF